MAKHLYHLTTEKIHLNVNFMSEKEDIQEKGDMWNLIKGDVSNSDM
jgi:hypothetical protein